MAGAFQGNAFQNNAFQVPATNTVGYRSLVGRQVGGMGVPGTTPPQAAGFRSFWGRQVGGMGVPGAAVKKVVGWPDTLRRRVPRKLLERLLQMQKDATFGRRWFEEFEAAQREFVEADAKAAAQIAAEEARKTAELIHDRGREEEFSDALRATAISLEASRQLKRTKDILDASDLAIRQARWVRNWIEQEDEEEIISLLLH